MMVECNCAREEFRSSKQLKGIEEIGEKKIGIWQYTRR